MRQLSADVMQLLWKCSQNEEIISLPTLVSAYLTSVPNKQEEFQQPGEFIDFLNL